MNAKNVSRFGIGLTLTALALCGALAISASCAGSGGSGGSAGSGQGGGGGGQGGSGSGGSSSTAGCPTDPGTSGDINFCNGKAQGTATGYGWVALGSLDTISDPTCDTDTHAITKAAPCTTTTNWNASDALCASGSIPALPASPVQSDYDNNWGVEIGVNTSEPSGQTTLGGNYTKVTITVSGSPTTGLRAQVHRKGDGDSGVYCANMTSGTAISLTSFSTQCWSGCPTAAPATGAVNDTSVCYPLAAADIPNIDHVHIQVPSTQSAITVDKLCLKEILFQ